MVAGADSIEDMNLLRHGGMGRLFTGRLRAVDAGVVPAQLRVRACASARRGRGPAGRQPGRADAAAARTRPQIAYLDVDDTIRATYGYAKQGAGYGYSGVKGLNALLAALSTPAAAPVIVATRLRKGSANSARGAARLVADALRTSRACGAGGLLVVRADSAFYGRDVIAAIGRAGARFSVTARQDTRGAARDRLDPGGGVDDDPLPPRGLRRAAWAVGQRRPGRRECRSPRSPPAAGNTPSPPG